MWIQHLTLHNFRNYPQLEVSFSPKVNLFWGNNGQGKTNLLEAIHILSTGRSFRTHHLQDAIREQASYFYIEAQFVKDGVSQSLKIYYDGTSRKISYNRNTSSHFSSLLGILPSILLSPDDLSLISGGPAERRRFLDLHLAQIDPLYLFYLSRYYKAMKQRNALLRSQDLHTLSAWEQVMAPAASYLIAKRQELAALLQEPASQWIKLFSHEREEMSFSYSHSLLQAKDTDLVDKLLTQWKKMRPKEMHYGTTQTGPHRDDLFILLCGRQAKEFGSEGQKRSCIASLRFAQWKHMHQLLDVPPLLCIDDFGIQLDPERYSQFAQHFPQSGQVFLTSPQSIEQHLEGKSFQIAHGSVLKQS